MGGSETPAFVTTAVTYGKRLGQDSPEANGLCSGGHLTMDRATTMRGLGIRVRNCNLQKAETNPFVFKGALAVGY